MGVVVGIVVVVVGIVFVVPLRLYQEFVLGFDFGSVLFVLVVAVVAAVGLVGLEIVFEIVAESCVGLVLACCHHDSLHYHRLLVGGVLGQEENESDTLLPLLSCCNSYCCSHRKNCCSLLDNGCCGRSCSLPCSHRRGILPKLLSDTLKRKEVLVQ